MASLKLCTLPLPIENEVEFIAIDRYGDLLLTLHNPYISNSREPCTFQFQISSSVMCFNSWYFQQAFQKKWLETQVQVDGKYHFTCTGFDAEALCVLLLTIHKEALCRFDDDYYVTQFLPTEVTLDMLVGMVEIIDYWQMLSASQMMHRTSARWFDQFQSPSVPVWNDWELPNEYGSEIMMWWCLAESFDPVSKNGMSLRDAVERIIFKHAEGAIENFGWPISQQQLAEMEYWRKCNSAFDWDHEN